MSIAEDMERCWDVVRQVRALRPALSVQDVLRQALELDARPADPAHNAPSRPQEAPGGDATGEVGK